MIRTVQVKDAGQIRDLCHQALGYDSTLEKVAAQIDKFNSPDSGHFCFVYEEDQTGHILGYAEAEVYESLYSDAGLNVLGLAWDWSPIDGASRRSCQKQAFCFYPFKFCLSSKRSASLLRTHWL